MPQHDRFEGLNYEFLIIVCFSDTIPKEGANHVRICGDQSNDG